MAKHHQLQAEPGLQGTDRTGALWQQTYRNHYIVFPLLKIINFQNMDM